MAKSVYLDTQLIIKLDDDGNFVEYILDGGKIEGIFQDDKWDAEVNDKEYTVVTEVFSALKKVNFNTI